ncbi:MAG: peptidylprolyl isomerase [Gammaproteobacteria bacterium]|nr:peptidylprolyl isomerase [Gammaproteobacteria bacterium]
MNAMNALKGAVLTLALALLAACGSDKSGTTTAETPADAAAVVNGEPVTQEAVAFYAERRTGMPVEQLDPEMREQIVNELINIELLAQEARNQGLDQRAPLKQELAFQRATGLADASMTAYLEQDPISEDTLRAEYEARVAELGSQEFKASHILVEDEETANAIIAELDEGADFETLARERSIEPGAEQSAGSLGWFAPSQMVEPFATAVGNMEDGSISAAPVQTQFGWHVIRREESRDVPPPAFEDIKPQIERFLTNQKIQEYINVLRNDANIEKSGPAVDTGSADAEGTEEAPEAAE